MEAVHLKKLANSKCYLIYLLFSTVLLVLPYSLVMIDKITVQFSTPKVNVTNII